MNRCLTPTQTYTATATETGQFTIADFSPGIYDVRANNAHTHSNKCSAIALAVGDDSFDLGLL